MGATSKARSPGRHLGQLSLATKGPSLEKAVQATSRLTQQCKHAPRGSVAVNRRQDSLLCCSFPCAAKTIIVLFLDRMFAFELKSPPPPNLPQFGSTRYDEGLGSSHDGWWLLAQQRPLHTGKERKRRAGGEEKHESVILSNTGKDCLQVGSCCPTLLQREHTKYPAFWGTWPSHR